ncbi:FlgO family outer membrane protein [Marinobacterium sp. YM272]|uniref:FlgO family outer membrane protein n=1 Tax=Marinobacterium sp. YM272 TaxID=3421654 RepID=UPI003D7FABD5
MIKVTGGLGVALLLLLSGCARHEQLEPVQVERFGPEALSQVDSLLNPGVESGRQGRTAALTRVDESNEGIDPISEAVQQLAGQLANGLDENRIRRLPMAVLKFHDLMQRDQVGPVGERLSDSFIFQLEHLGYNLVDYRAVSLTTSTKPVLDPSSLSLLRRTHRIYFVLTGTYARQPGGLVINARVLDTTTRQVLASGQTHIPTSRLEGQWPGYDPLKALQSGMIIENRQGPAGLDR